MGMGMGMGRAGRWSVRALGRGLGLVLMLGLEGVVDAEGGLDAEGGVEVAAVAPTPVTVPWVLYRGCSEVRPGHRCEIEPGATLTVWAEVPVGATLLVDGSPVEVKTEIVERGTRWTVTPRAGARRVEVVWEGEGVSSRFALALEVRARVRVPGLEEIEALPDVAVARRTLARLLPQLEGEARVLGLELAGKLAHDANDLGARFEAYEDGVAAARAVGWNHEASVMAQMIVYGCIVLRKPKDEECARRWLEIDARLVGEDSAQQLNHAYYEGMVAAHRGDVGRAVRAYRDQGRASRALGDANLEAAAVLEEMVLVGRLGDHVRTKTLLARVRALAPQVRENKRSQLVNGAASMLLEARARGVASEDPLPLLKRALELAGDGGDAITVRHRQAILLNMAYAAVLDQQAAVARQWLERVDADALDDENQRWWLLLSARVAALEGDAEQALRHFAKLLDQADRLREPDLQWHGLIGRGQALETLERPLEARASYAEAEALLEAQASRIARDEGRESFMAERDRGARAMVELLLEQQDVEAALCTARLARTRSVRLLARQRHRAASTPAVRDALQRYQETRTELEAEYEATWTLSRADARRRRRELAQAREANEDALDRALAAGDAEPSEPPTCAQLPRVPAGQLDLHYMQLDDGWVGFAVDAEQRIIAKELDALALDDPAGREAWPEWGRVLLEPFAEPIARARRIRIMPAGALTRVPFHALPVGGKGGPMLLERAVVRYGVDLPKAAVAAEAPGLESGAALVVVPPSNLPHADLEARVVRAALERRGGRVELLDGDAARGNTMRAALELVDFLHYVGHARSAGPSGWGSRLSLALDDTLEVADVLALSRAPSTVVLSGCETGLADPHALAGGMSLAQGFVIAGAEQVVASSGKLDDAAAVTLMQALYGAVASGEAGDVDMALALALAQRRGTDEGRLYVQSFAP